MPNRGGSEGGLAKDHTFSLLCLFGICNSVTRPTNMSYSDHIRHPPVLLGLCPLYLLLPCPRRRCQMCLWTLGLLCHLLLGSGCICVHVLVYLYLRLCACICICVCALVFVFASVHLYLYLRLSICICICVLLIFVSGHSTSVGHCTILRNSASIIHWLSSSIFNVCCLFVRPASVTPPLISTI